MLKKWKCGDVIGEDIEQVPDEISNPEPTSEERMEALETTTDDMILLMADLIGGE